MRVAVSPYMQLPPASPPPPSPSKSSNMPMLYYGLVVVGTAAIVLAIYNIFIIKWCADHHHQPRQGSNSLPQRGEQGGSSRSFSESSDNPNANLISSFKYRKQGGEAAGRDETNDYECAVCLSVFEEGQDVRQLPRCKHSFHTPCIDMWLYSHHDCPLCRTLVEPPVLNRIACPVRPARSSREGLLDPSIFGL